MPNDAPDPSNGPTDDINLFSYIQVLLKWRRFLLFNVLVVAGLVAIYALFQPNVYKATSSVIPPKQESGLGGALSQLTKDFLPSGVLGKLGANQGAYNYLAILESRRAMESVVAKFNLMDRYEITNNSMERAVGMLRENAIFDVEENGNVTVSAIDRDPRLAAEMANYFVEVLNTISIELGTQEARNNRLFVEKRYEQAMADMHAAEDSLKTFQKKHGIYALPEQTKAAIEEAAQLKAQASISEIELGMLERSLGKNNPQTSLKRSELTELNAKLRQLKFGEETPGSSESVRMFIPFADIPELGMQYLRLYRNFEIQNKILQFAIPIYEQAKIDEQKTVPVVLVLDNAVAPERKWGPPRSLIVFVSAMIAFFFSAFAVYFMDYFMTRRVALTSIEAAIIRRFEGIARLYRVKH